MSTPALAAENKALARRCREDLWKPGNLAIADQIFDSDAVIRTYDPLTPDFGKGPEAMSSSSPCTRQRFRMRPAL